MEEWRTLTFISVWLAAYGIAFMVSSTDGPFEVLLKIRRKVIEFFGEDQVKTGIECPICTGFWISAGLAWCFDVGVLGWLSSVGFICVVTALRPKDDEPDSEDLD